MNQFEYLSVLVSIIIGLGITHLLTGAGRFVGGPQAPRVYRVHLVWTLNLVLFQAFFWWFTFKWDARPTWTFGLFLFILGYAVLLYLLTVILYPVEIEHGFDFRAHFHRRRRLFFRLLALVGLIDAVDTMLKGEENVDAVPAVGALVLLLNIGGPLIAERFDSDRFHLAYSIFWGVVLVLWILFSQGVLGG